MILPIEIPKPVSMHVSVPDGCASAKTPPRWQSREIREWAFAHLEDEIRLLIINAVSRADCVEPVNPLQK